MVLRILQKKKDTIRELSVDLQLLTITSQSLQLIVPYIIIWSLYWIIQLVNIHG